MKKSIVLLFICAGIMLIGACQRSFVPARISGNVTVQPDTDSFEYFYVEALRQKLEGNNGDALKYLEQCTRFNPRSDAPYFQMAQILEADGDLKNSKKYIKKAIDLDNRNEWYMLMLSRIYYQEKNIDSAIVCYENTKKIDPDNQNILLALGNLYSEDNKFSKADAIFEALEKEFGTNNVSTLAYVKNLMLEGNYVEAQAKIEELLKINPEEITYNGLLAEVYRAEGENDKAMAIYKKLMEQSPDNPQVEMSLSDFLLTEKNYSTLFELLNHVVLNEKIKKEDKIAMFSKMVENSEINNGDNGNKLLILLLILEANYKDDDLVQMIRPELLMKMSNEKGATERLEQIIQEKPTNYYAWERLLFLYLETGDFKKLTEKGAECTRMFNMSFPAKLLYANGAMETGQYNIALEQLRQADILAGNDPNMKIQVLTMKADVYYRMKQFPQAFNTFEQAIKVNGNDLTVLNNYAYYLAEQNQKLKEAEQMAKKVIQAEKDNTTFLDTYGWVLYKRGKISEAAKVMQEVIGSGKKDDAEWYEHYGYILMKLRKCDKAVESWQRAMKLDGKKGYLQKEIDNCKR